MKTKEQIYMEARDYLERKLEKLAEDKLYIEQEIKRTEKLLEDISGIYNTK